MSRVFFHCISSGRTMPDRVGRSASDISDAYAAAVLAVRRLLAVVCDEDWRAWRMLVVDEQDELLFDIPFAALLGPAH